ncbi:MAG: Na(+)-translocating NADH-quinone reductase subunit C [Candidatus Ozemobacter sibiricus]|uniref:Na(+)-translocating NADH-quinone reductase subunit C n=1 Tax=Candidatus Ozemobacter sibiricus TaxID=2268124 RepID=A0A367ZNC3_9BACT|nr:MAG: Na(+)-translocating NADH-quinone reductase subunit C [Candidatus Ozemobacter sibiricus]
MSQKLRVVLFTVAVTIVFGGLVSGLNALLADRIALNAQAARQRVILHLLGLATPEAAAALPADQAAARFAAEVRSRTLGPGPDGTTAVCFERAATTAASGPALLVFPFAGQGFWDAIRGYVAIDAGSRRIAGIVFTEHAETPGLGGRISEPGFAARFQGKPLDQPAPDGRRLRLVSEGSAAQPTEIDGLTGASETTRAVERIINRTADLIIALLANPGGPQP